MRSSSPLVFASLLLVTQTAVAGVAFTVNSVLDQPDDLTMPGICHTTAGTCTLRAAVMQANRSSGAGATILLPAGLYSLTIPAMGADGDESGDLNLTTPAEGNPVITLVGEGAGTTRIETFQFQRILRVSGGRTAILSDVTLSGGSAVIGGGILSSGNLSLIRSEVSANHADTYGGGIYNYGTLTASQSTISNNNAASDGGGIYNTGTLTVSQSSTSGNLGDYGGGIFNYLDVVVDHSTISQNVATSRGGGIYSVGTLQVDHSTVSGNGAPELGGGICGMGLMNVSRTTVAGNSSDMGGGIWSAGTLTVTQSTISGNHGNFGGGLYNGLALFVVNSTISENDADSDGGGAYNGGVYGASVIANVYNTTIAFNGADADRDEVYGGTGGGVYNQPLATFNLRNSLVAGNVVENLPVPDDCIGTLSSYGRNLIGDLGGPAPCTISITTGSWTGLNSTALIDILRDNGGPTQTHALLPGSNAIDGGDPTFGCTDYNGNTIATDQRGAPRATGVRCDIGAFEVPEPASMAAAAVAIVTLASMRSATRDARKRNPVDQEPI